MKKKQKKQVGIVSTNDYRDWLAEHKVKTILQKIKNKAPGDLTVSESFESQYGNISGSSNDDPPTFYDGILDEKQVTKINKGEHYEPKFTKREDRKEMGWKDFQKQVDSLPTQLITKGDLFKDGYRIVEDFITKEECQEILDNVAKDDRPIMKRLNYEMGLSWGELYDPQEPTHDRLSDLFSDGLTTEGICTGKRIQEFYLIASPYHPAESYPSVEEMEENPDKYESFSLPIFKLYKKLETYLSLDYGVEHNDYSWNANFQFYFPGSFIAFHNDGVVEGRLGVVLLCLNEKFKSQEDFLKDTGFTTETIKHQDPASKAVRWYNMNKPYEGGDLILYPEPEIDIHGNFPDTKRNKITIKSKPGKLIILDFTKNNIFHELTELENWTRVSFVGFFFAKGKEAPDLTPNTY